MPVYNEAPTVGGMIQEILAELNPLYEVQLIVVESGSTDGTHEIVSKLEKEGIIEAIYQPTPLGKGSAVREGLKLVTNSVTIIFDGDREYSAKDVPALVQPIFEGESDFVLGSRFKVGEPMRSFGKNKFFKENGFAFDVELVAKLIRSGYKPIEIPVSYKSRGFSEGKKIRFFRDGYALPIALVRHRYSQLNINENRFVKHS